MSLPGENGGVTQVVAGELHALALTASGQLYSFGYNYYGELGITTNSGNENANPTPKPVSLAGVNGAVDQIVAGGYHSLFVTSSGQLYAFGDNGSGQLGTESGMSTANPTPTLVGLPGQSGAITQVGAGEDDSLVVTASGQLYTFGDNEYGELGNAANSSTSNPNPTPTVAGLPAGTTIDTIAKGPAAEHTLAIISDLAISSNSLPGARVAQRYSTTVSTTGGSPPLDLSSSGLPSGLSIAPTSGLISGTPTSTGSFPVTLTVSDRYGNLSSRTLTLTVAPAPCARGQIGSPPTCHTPPTLGRLSQTHRRWRDSGKAKLKGKPPLGTSFSYRLNERATITLAFTQKAAGRKVKHRCQAPSKRNRRTPRCTRTLTRETLMLIGHGGLNNVRFNGKISHNRKLRPGKYMLVITAHAGGIASTPRTLSFTITAS